MNRTMSHMTHTAASHQRAIKMFWLLLEVVMLSILLYSVCNETNLSASLFVQGNIRVFCRVRPLVGGGLSKHIQLPANDIKSITLAKTEEVRILSAYRIFLSLKL